MALLQKAYLGATPLFRNTSWFEDNAYTVANRSSAVTVTADASAHTKGSWVQLVASTSANASAIYVEANVAANGFDTSCLLDIGTGASGSETALISNIAIGGARTATGLSGYVFTVPIQVPSGTRISARIQHITGGEDGTILVEARDYGNYAQSPTSVDVIGTDTATSTGTDFVTANTYVQLTSSTSRAYRAIVMLPNVSGNALATVTATLTLATGASGSEVELGARYASYSNAESVQTIDDFFVAASVASGTRLAVKVQGPPTNLTNYGVCLIGIP
jgi:hypothetical protein